MAGGEAHVSGDNCAYDLLKEIHTVPVIESNSNAHMATPLETRSSEITDEVMARRLKNRERQRRYRARKRLEEDIKKSCMTQQCAWLPNEQQLCDTATVLGSQEVQLPAESQSDAAIIPSSDRVHCSRKWKKDARQAHLFRNIENSPAEVLHSVEPVLECESTVKNNQTSSIRRRDWKAEARSKSKIEIGTAEHGLQT